MGYVTENFPRELLILNFYLSFQVVDVRPADDQTAASNDHDDVPALESTDSGKTFDADEDKYREKPRYGILLYLNLCHAKTSEE